MGLLIKNQVSSRRIRTFDKRCCDVLLFNRINDKYILAKLKGEERPYWSLMDTYGNIKKIPSKMLLILNSKNWNFIKSQVITTTDDSESSQQKGVLIMLQSYSDEKHNNTDRFLRQLTTRKSIAEEAEETNPNKNIKRTKNPFPDIHVFAVDPDVSRLKN